MATIPIPQGATLEPIQQAKAASGAVLIPQGARLEPLPPTAAPQFKPGFAEGVSGAAIGIDSPESLDKTLSDQEQHPLMTALKNTPPAMAARMVGDYFSTLYGRGKEAVKEAYDAGQNIGNGQPAIPNLAKAQLGVSQAGLAAIPFVGEQANKVGEDVSQGNYGAAAGRALTTEAMLGIGGEKGGLEKPEVANIRPTGAQAKVYPQIGSMPAKAVHAAEGIFQAAAPTGTNVNFRKSLYTALPDLAEVARKVNLSETKGGIINPDMRVEATVKAIDAHLKDMYATERAPQIQAHANEPVQLSLDPNTRRGLEYLANHAGLAEEQALAAQALRTGKLSVAATDKLAQTANQYLLKYESASPEGKMQMEATNPKIGGLKALDRSVGNALNNVLEAAGEPGLRGYEQRYAALSKVRDGLRPRINAEELKRSIDLGIVGKGIKAVTGGKSGIASASQSAVADVNVGKKLQNSMKTLADSSLMPNRAIRRVSPTSTQSLPEQSQ